MKNDALNRTKLNNLSKDALILLLLQQSENFQLLSEQSSVIQKQNEQLIKQIESLKEQLAILTNHRFGRKTEVSSRIPGQLSLDFGDQAILNEAELAVAESLLEEPTIEEVIVRKKRTKGKRAANLDSIEVESVYHGCTEEELTTQFPKGWHELPDEVYKELLYTPAKFKVLEHHIKVYAGAFQGIYVGISFSGRTDFSPCLFV